MRLAPGGCCDRDMYWLVTRLMSSAVGVGDVGVRAGESLAALPAAAPTLSGGRRVAGRPLGEGTWLGAGGVVGGVVSGTATSSTAYEIKGRGQQRRPSQ